MTAVTTMQTAATIPRITGETKFSVSQFGCTWASVNHINSKVLKGSYFIALI